MTPVGPCTLMVASGSPAKIEAVRQAARVVLPGCSVQAAVVDSGVARQPLGMAAVRRGAVSRALAAAKVGEGAWGIGLENGLVTRAGRIYAVGWCAVADGRRVLGVSSAPEFVLPAGLTAEVREAMRAGGTLAEATARFFGGTPDRWRTEGTVAALTSGAVARAELWRIPVILALTSANWRLGLRSPAPGP